jgi:hypothetical protein
MKRTESAEKKSKSNGSSTRSSLLRESGNRAKESPRLPALQSLKLPELQSLDPRGRQGRSTEFAVCMRNDGYCASLETRKIYPVVPDSAAPVGMIRVTDESGEDYLYPADWFEPIKVTPRLREALRMAS